MERYHFPVDIEIDEDGIYVVSCPTFRGCHAAGKTINEALVELKGVAEMCREEQHSASLN